MKIHHSAVQHEAIVNYIRDTVKAVHRNIVLGHFCLNQPGLHDLEVATESYQCYHRRPYHDTHTTSGRSFEIGTVFINVEHSFIGTIKVYSKKVTCFNLNDCDLTSKLQAAVREWYTTSNNNFLKEALMSNEERRQYMLKKGKRRKNG